MAKSEYTPDERTADDGFDLEAFMETDFGSLPPKQTISGAWLLKIVSTYVDHGTDTKNDLWTAIDLNMDPQFPVGDDANDVISELDMTDLPQIRQRFFITSLSQQRDFAEKVVRAFGVTPAKLSVMRQELRGAEAVATIKSVARRGKVELRASYFREAPDFTPPFGENEVAELAPAYKKLIFPKPAPVDDEIPF